MTSESLRKPMNTEGFSITQMFIYSLIHLFMQSMYPFICPPVYSSIHTYTCLFNYLIHPLSILSTHRLTPVLSHMSIYLLYPLICPPTHLATHSPNPSNLQLPGSMSSCSYTGELLSPPGSYLVEVFFLLIFFFYL